MRSLWLSVGAGGTIEESKAGYGQAPSDTDGGWRNRGIERGHYSFMTRSPFVSPDALLFKKMLKGTARTFKNVFNPLGGFFGRFSDDAFAAWGHFDPLIGIPNSGKTGVL